ncbi:MAG TPA: site-specific integrase, partial [Microbacterium sp.]|nr:site-specific integrase [Microbacterium sp.]
MPPVGVKLTTDVERRVDGFRARVRWTDPSTKKRVGRVTHVRTAEEVEEFFEQMRAATETGNDTTVTLADYAATIGDRWQRGLDPTSTAELYDTGLRLRVLPALGHIRVAKITA